MKRKPVKERRGEPLTADEAKKVRAYLEEKLKAIEKSQPKTNSAPNRKPWANTTKAKWGEILRRGDDT